MRPIRVCIYGGTDLQGTPPKFIAALANEFLTSVKPSVIVTGGYRYALKKQAAISTDMAALEGAREYAEREGKNLKDCFEAWIPDPALDRHDRGGVVRLGEADGVTLRTFVGRTALGRRLAMVAGVDMLVTIAGREHTEVVMEQALELGVPVLPIPDAGGDSADLLTKYRERIAASFRPGALADCLKKVADSIQTDPKSAAQAVVELMKTAKVGKCLVLMPFDDEHNLRYRDLVRPAIEEHMLALRLDDLPKSGAIYASFADAIQSSAAVIADITQLNENVMYEIGFAHGRGLTPMLFTLVKKAPEELPLYLRTLNVREATPLTMGKLIGDYLRDVKQARKV